jgi:hypothetical protein
MGGKVWGEEEMVRIAHLKLNYTYNIATNNKIITVALLNCF